MCLGIFLYKREAIREGRSELPDIAAKPPTNPPINAVTIIMAIEDPPRGNSSAIL